MSIEQNPRFSSKNFRLQCGACIVLLLATVTLCFFTENPVVAAPRVKRAAVTSAEVNGTFIQDFGKEWGHLCNTIKIHAIGNNKLDVSFDLYYPQRDAQGELAPNVGSTEGQATIYGDTAVFQDKSSGPGKITIIFDRPGHISVSQEGDCGFGFNVTADGDYVKSGGGGRRNKKSK